MLVLVVTLASCSSPSEDDSDWVTYESEEYGFSIEYPAIFGDFNENLEANTEDVQIKFYVLVRDDRDFAISHIISELEDHLNEFELIESENIEIGGDEAIMIEFKSRWQNNTVRHRDIFVLKNGVRYTLSLTAEESSYTDYEDMFWEIEESFRVEELPKQEVLDCSGEECEYREISFRIYGCDFWRNHTNCMKTSKGVEQVSYIADSDNYITAPFTEEEFTVEYILSEEEHDNLFDMDVTEDGVIIIFQRDGNIIEIEPNGNTVDYNIDELGISAANDKRLLRGAVDPAFRDDRYVYIFYETERDGNYSTMRLSRIRVNDGDLDETALIDDMDTIEYGIGRLEMGPDRKLYLPPGRITSYKEILSGSINHIGEKILRINTDGSVPEDNPYNGSYVYSSGHDAPNAIAWDEQGIMYNTEMRFTGAAQDVINKVEAGDTYSSGILGCDNERRENAKSYGYEEIREMQERYNVDLSLHYDPENKEHSLSTGNVFLDDIGEELQIRLAEDVKKPDHCIDGGLLGPGSMEFVDDEESPWHDSLFVASVKGKHLHRFEFEDGEIATSEIFFVAEGRDYNEINEGSINRFIEAVEYHDGSLYVLGTGGGLVKLTPQ